MPDPRIELRRELKTVTDEQLHPADEERSVREDITGNSGRLFSEERHNC
jgi:hypothetical protein